MKINRSEEPKRGVIESLKKSINSLRKIQPMIPLPMEQFTRVAEQYDVVHRMTLQKVTK